MLAGNGFRRHETIWREYCRKQCLMNEAAVFSYLWETGRLKEV